MTSKSRAAGKYDNCTRVYQLRQYFCGMHRIIMTARDNVPELKIKMLVILFQEIESGFKRHISKLVK